MMNILAVAGERFFVNLERQGLEHTRNPHNFTSFSDILGAKFDQPMPFLYDQDNKRIVSLSDLIKGNYGRLSVFRIPGLVFLDPVGFAVANGLDRHYFLQMHNIVPNSLTIAEKMEMKKSKGIAKEHRIIKAIRNAHWPKEDPRKSNKRLGGNKNI